MIGWQQASLAGWLLAAATALWGCGAAPVAAPAPLPAQASRGSFEVVARLEKSAMPTGVAISQENRTFLCFPRWDDGMLCTVGELLPSGKVVYYPDMHYNQPDPDAPRESLFSLQSLAVDARNRLWLLDTGRIRWNPVVEKAAKLVAVDLYVNKLKTFVLPADVLRPASYLNDLCVDLRKGTEGVAYITDSGVGAIIVVDLATGQAMRRLDGHPSTQAQEVQLVVEGQPLYVRPSAGESPARVQVGVDGIALSQDGETLYYCPLSSRRLYCVPTSALLSPRVGEEELAGYVRDLGPKPAADGMIMDAHGALYLGAIEHNAVMRRLPNGTLETVAQDARLLWPGRFAIGPDGSLYVVVNQMHRHQRFQGGVNRRQLPYLLVRIPLTVPAE